MIHEKYHPAILRAANQYRDDSRVEGLLFNYVHFYGTYDYVGDSRKWYHKEVRIVRNDSSIRAYRDAQGFRKNGEKLNVKPVDAFVYHYGWVKSPKQMKDKQKRILEFWQDPGNIALRAQMKAGDVFDFHEFDSLDHFCGTHPAVMQKRIAEKNWNIDLDITRKKFSLKEKLLYWYEKRTGKRLFDLKTTRSSDPFYLRLVIKERLLPL